MDVQLNIYQLEKIITEAARMGARVTLSRLGKLKPFLKKSEAFRIYGRTNVEQWISEGLLTPRKDGGHSACWRIEWLEIEAVAKSKILIRFL